MKERPEVARKVLLVLREVTDKIQANFDQYRPLLAKYVGVPEASLPTVKKLVFRNERDVNERDLKSMAPSEIISLHSLADAERIVRRTHTSRD